MSDAVEMVWDRRRAGSRFSCPALGPTTFLSGAPRRAGVSRVTWYERGGARSKPCPPGVHPVEVEVDEVMIVLGADAHNRSHTIVASLATTGELVGEQTVQVGAKGFAALLAWARRLGGERVWAIEDCRHVSGSFERFLIGRGERVLRVTTKLMAASRRGVRGRGKSDSIDAMSVARAALREGLDALPAAQLEGPELDLRLLVDHRERLVRQRVALNNSLQWHLHDLWPELELPGSSLFYGTWAPRVARRLARAEQTMRVRIARAELRRIREVSQTIKALQSEIAGLVAQTAPQLLSEPGFGPLTVVRCPENRGNSSHGQRTPATSADRASRRSGFSSLCAGRRVSARFGFSATYRYASHHRMPSGYVIGVSSPIGTAGRAEPSRAMPTANSSPMLYPRPRELLDAGAQLVGSGYAPQPTTGAPRRSSTRGGLCVTRQARGHSWKSQSSSASSWTRGAATSSSAAPGARGASFTGRPPPPRPR